MCMYGGKSNLELVLEKVFLVGQLAVEAEEPLLVGRHFLCVHVRLLAPGRCGYTGTGRWYGTVGCARGWL